MSVRLMTAVWELQLKDSEKLVMLALADCANDEGLAWPSMATLGRKCGRSERTIQGVMISLEKRGLIKREQIVGKGCRYYLFPDPTPAAAAPRRECAPQRTAQTPAAAAGKPSKNHSVSNETGSKPPADPVKALFDLAVEVLTQAGQSERSARSQVGKWRRTHGDGETSAALLEARSKTDPSAWLQRRLSGATSTSDRSKLFDQARRLGRSKAPSAAPPPDDQVREDGWFRGAA